MLNIRVGRVGRDGDGVYIGRAGRGREGSPLANPFRIGRDGDRRGVIDKYRRWLWQQMVSGNEAVMAELNRLLSLAKRPEGVTLLCFCRGVNQTRPACHGDVIAAALRWLDGLGDDPATRAALGLGGKIVRAG